MRCVIAIGLLVFLTSVVCEDDRIEPARPRQIGVIYLIQLVNQPPEVQNDYSEISNSIPSDNPYEKVPSHNKFLIALAPSDVPQEKGREKRSPEPEPKASKFGGGGGGCNRCGGGGYYPGGGGGYGGGSSGSWSKASASSGSYGSGHGKGYGK